MDKLIDNMIVNQTKWPEIFNLTEKEVLEAMEAVREYSLVKDSESYSDWAKMYNGIHRESTYESTVRGWLACIRWMNRKRQERIRGVIDSMNDNPEDEY